MKNEAIMKKALAAVEDMCQTYKIVGFSDLESPMWAQLIRKGDVLLVKNSQRSISIELDMTEDEFDLIYDDFRDAKYDYILDNHPTVYAEGAGSENGIERNERIDRKVKELIADYMDLEAYDMDTTIENVYEVFQREFVHHNNEHLPKTTLFKDWLMGLPSAMCIPFYYWDINGIVTSWGINHREMNDSEVSELYFKRIANVFMTMVKTEMV